MLLFALIACGSPKDTGCADVVDGTWTLSGSCFSSGGSARLTYDAAGCAFSLQDATAHDPPTGGLVHGSTATLTGPSWSGCTGTISSDGAKIAGSCASCDFTLTGP